MSKKFSKLLLETMSPEQRVIAERSLGGPRGKFDGTLNVLLRAPRVADPIEQLGERVRFQSVLPDRLKELAILVIARHMTSPYAWSMHNRLAVRAGISKDAVLAIAQFGRPTELKTDEKAVYNLCRALLDGSILEDADYDVFLNLYDQTGVIELVGLLGYYTIVCMVKHLDDVEGVIDPEFPPLPLHP